VRLNRETVESVVILRIPKLVFDVSLAVTMSCYSHPSRMVLSSVVKLVGARYLGDADGLFVVDDDLAGLRFVFTSDIPTQSARSEGDEFRDGDAGGKYDRRLVTGVPFLQRVIQRFHTYRGSDHICHQLSTTRQ
jgi:hypothetical protein